MFEIYSKLCLDILREDVCDNISPLLVSIVENMFSLRYVMTIKYKSHSVQNSDNFGYESVAVICRKRSVFCTTCRGTFQVLAFSVFFLSEMKSGLWKRKKTRALLRFPGIF